tara:strand:+ start:7657 stop:7914 length:258 start_codon:yes stop_codon:yes gene_type:complete
MKSVFFVNHAAEYKNMANANAVKKFRIFLDTFQPEMFFFNGIIYSNQKPILPFKSTGMISVLRHHLTFRMPIKEIVYARYYVNKS